MNSHTSLIELFANKLRGSRNMKGIRRWRSTIESTKQIQWNLGGRKSIAEKRKEETHTRRRRKNQ